MKEKLTILVVGGHPADVFDHCGGTLAHHVAQGDRVVCLALTQGLWSEGSAGDRLAAMRTWRLLAAPGPLLG